MQSFYILPFTFYEFINFNLTIIKIRVIPALWNLKAIPPGWGLYFKDLIRIEHFTRNRYTGYGKFIQKPWPDAMKFEVPLYLSGLRNTGLSE